MAEPVPFPTPAAPFRRAGLGYVFEPDGLGVRFCVDKLVRSSEGLRARISVESTLPGLPTHIYAARHLLEGTRSLADLRKGLEELSPGQGIPWGTLVRQVTKAVVDAEDAGPRVLRLGDIATRPRLPDLVEWLVPQGKTSRLYGPGGYGKGYLAVGMAVAIAAGVSFAGLAVQRGPVLYLDWEDDDWTFRERVEAICRGRPEPLDPRALPLAYARCERPLPEEVEWLSRRVDADGIVLTVVDSVEMASAGGEHRNYNDRATELARALRLVHCGHLLIDHVSDEGRRGTGLAGKAIGGIMKQNLARNEWEIKREQGTGDAVSHLGLYHAKTNHSAFSPPLGFVLDFSTPDTVAIRREDVRNSPTLAAPTNLGWRIEGYLVHVGCRPIKAIADELDVPEKSVETALRRGEQAHRFQVVIPGTRGGAPAQWGVCG